MTGANLDTPGLNSHAEELAKETKGRAPHFNEVVLLERRLTAGATAALFDAADVVGDVLERDALLEVLFVRHG